MAKWLQTTISIAIMVGGIAMVVTGFYIGAAPSARTDVGTVGLVVWLLLPGGFFLAALGILGFLVYISGGPDSIAEANARYWRDQELRREAEREESRREAQRTERAGRLEDAAWQYERLGMLDKAGELRRELRTQRMRGKVEIEQITRNVQVDLVKLMEQVRREGLVLPYRCPQCGGSLSISGQSEPSSLTSCPYCHSFLDTSSTADFIRRGLG